MTRSFDLTSKGPPTGSTVGEESFQKKTKYPITKTATITTHAQIEVRFLGALAALFLRCADDPIGYGKPFKRRITYTVLGSLIQV